MHHQTMCSEFSCCVDDFPDRAPAEKPGVEKESKKRAVCSVECVLCSVDCSVCSVQCAVCSVLTVVCSVP